MDRFLEVFLSVGLTHVEDKVSAETLGCVQLHRNGISTENRISAEEFSERDGDSALHSSAGDEQASANDISSLRQMHAVADGIHKSDDVGRDFSFREDDKVFKIGRAS